MQRGISVELLATRPISVKEMISGVSAVLMHVGVVVRRVAASEDNMCSIRSTLELDEPSNTFVSIPYYCYR